MLKKQETRQLVFGFHTTADAMAAESAFKKSSLSGRIIPVPRAMSTGCGLAWCMDPELQSEAETLLQEQGIIPEATEILMLRV